MTIEERIQRDFHYPLETESQIDRHIQLRQKGLELARLVVEHCPDGRERSLAITNIEQAIMWAAASISRSQAPVDL